MRGKLYRQWHPRPVLESLEQRLMLDASPTPLEGLGDEPANGPAQGTHLFEFSLDIGSDTELSDPNGDGDEGFDPGDVYLWQSAPVTPPQVPGGRDGFKDDEMIFGHDPNPNPPDTGVPPATRAPVGEGTPEDYLRYFDLDGHDQIDFMLLELLPPEPLIEPIPAFASSSVFPAEYLFVSFDDDADLGWQVGDVPVTGPSQAGVIYGTTGGQDEIVGVTAAGGPAPMAVLSIYPVADEATVHASLQPNPDAGEQDDDDVDSLDVVLDDYPLTEWLFSADHEASLQLDPGVIYETTVGSGAFAPVILGDVHLGLARGTDIDAFELTWLHDPTGAVVLGVLFSVDWDDPFTSANESGGLDPRMIYGSVFTGSSFPLLTQPLADDVDGLTNWMRSLQGMDWGDAPSGAAAPGYPTLAANNGANHLIAGPWLGDVNDAPDSEPDGQPDLAAMGDDNDTGPGNPAPNYDDENGAGISALVIGQPGDVTVVVNGGGGVVEMWVDFNDDMTWQHPGEQVFSGFLPDGTHTFQVMAPAGSATGQTFARLRISTRGGLGPDGPAPDGEVEDHEVTIEEPPPEHDFGDAPDPTYPTLLVSNGASHVIMPRMYLGAGVDSEPDGQPDPNALGDDNDVLYPPANDDEDGVVFATQLIAGQTATVDVTASAAGLLNVWVDFNADGDWADWGEHVFVDLPLAWGTTSLSFTVPAGSTPWVKTFARFRFSSLAGLGYDGPAPDGEVEDYKVWIEDVTHGIKWAQPPVHAQPDNVFYGWNEPSVHEGWQIAADDWVCTTADPVTDITWWGSLLDWTDPHEPPMPDYFHLAIWTDVPAGADKPYSHPGQVVWETDCYDYTWQFVGWDYDPQTQTYEACFRFDQSLPQREWFYQDPVENNIYWLSVAAGYPVGGVTDYPFGWKTLPRDPGSPAPDDAVRIFDPTGAHVGQDFGAGDPIWWPTEADSWDLAFELRSVTGWQDFKWEQFPNLEPSGMDVNATAGGAAPFLLADDFECAMTGPLTEIAIWGSWLNDFYGRDAGDVTFTLSIHADIPADQSPTGYSMPGDLLWVQTFQPGTFNYFLYQDMLDEGWLDPPDGYIPSADTQCWTYIFGIDPDEAFVQTGTMDDPIVYWLDVQATPAEGGALFGWKTSNMHWNDSAVWVNATEPYTGTWEPFFEPLDLSFWVMGKEITERVKWSQPPQPYVPEDAFHGWDEPSIYRSQQIVADDWFCDTDQPVTDLHWWGSFIDWRYPEPPQMPRAFRFTFWTDVPAGADGSWSHPGEVIWEVYCDEYTWEFVGWDFDPRDPLVAPEATFLFEQYIHPEEWFWQEPGENIYWISIAADYGDQVDIEFPWGWKTRPRDPESPAPDDAVRIFDPTAPTVGSVFNAGEPIEWPEGRSWDMAFVLTTQDVFDWGDAPDRPYPTLLASGGARHRIVPQFHLGAGVDAEPDGQPTPLADGDDVLDGNDDEDGVTFTSVLVRNNLATVDVTASAPGMLDAWIDFAGDGSWAEAGDQIFASQPLAMGVNSLTFPVPPGAQVGTTVSRWRFSTAGGLPYDGPAPDGEVEDHLVEISPPAEIHGSKWHDQDGDRVWDVGEPGLNGWTIFLDDNADGALDPGERSTTTDANGDYVFDDLLPGTYLVDEVMHDAAWAKRFPAAGGQAVALLAGQVVTGVDFGNAVKGDCTGDAAVDYLDLGILATNYDMTGMDWTRGDFTDDGAVNYLDLGILATYYDYVYVPPPGPAGGSSGAPAGGAPGGADAGNSVAAPASSGEASAAAGLVGGAGALAAPTSLLSPADAAVGEDPAGVIVPAAAGDQARPWAELDDVVDLLAGPGLSVLPAALI